MKWIYWFDKDGNRAHDVNKIFSIQDELGHYNINEMDTQKILECIEFIEQRYQTLDYSTTLLPPDQTTYKDMEYLLGVIPILKREYRDRRLGNLLDKDYL